MHHPTRQDSTYHVLWYTSYGALAGMKNKIYWPTRKDQYDNQSHHVQMLYHGATSPSIFNSTFNTNLYWRQNLCIIKPQKVLWYGLISDQPCIRWAVTPLDILFKIVLNRFYFWLYAIRHMVKDHSDWERGKLLPPLHNISFSPLAPINLLYTPDVEWLEWEIA